MRVTFVTAGADLSGGCRVIAIYAERLRQRGHEVHVVTRPRRRFTLRDRVRALARGEPMPRSDKHQDMSVRVTGCSSSSPLLRHRSILRLGKDR